MWLCRSHHLHTCLGKERRREEEDVLNFHLSSSTCLLLVCRSLQLHTPAPRENGRKRTGVREASKQANLSLYRIKFSSFQSPCLLQMRRSHPSHTSAPRESERKREEEDSCQEGEKANLSLYLIKFSSLQSHMPFTGVSCSRSHLLLGEKRRTRTRAGVRRVVMRELFFTAIICNTPSSLVFRGESCPRNEEGSESRRGGQVSRELCGGTQPRLSQI